MGMSASVAMAGARKGSGGDGCTTGVRAAGVIVTLT